MMENNHFSDLTIVQEFDPDTLNPRPLGPSVLVKQANESSLDIVEKPGRPLSAYNLFFKDERRRILDSLPPSREKRSRNAHGKIGFQELAKIIGKRWKEADHETRATYFGLANEHKLRHWQALNKYNMYLGKVRQQELEAAQRLDDFAHLTDEGIPALAQSLGKEETDLVIKIFR